MTDKTKEIVIRALETELDFWMDKMYFQRADFKQGAFEFASGRVSGLDYAIKILKGEL